MCFVDGGKSCLVWSLFCEVNVINFQDNLVNKIFLKDLIVG